MLQRPHGGHQHHRVGGKAGHAALDVQEFLRAQVRAEARLGDHIVRQRQAQPGGHHAVAAVGDVGEGAAVDDGGVVLQRLDQVGVKGVLQKGGHGARRADLAGGHRLALVGVAHHDAGQPLLQIFQIGGQAEDGHHFAGHRDVKAVLPGGAVHLAAQAVGHIAQLPVVHVHAALPGHPAGVDVVGVALVDAVVHHGCQQVVGRADGVQVAGEVEVDVLHGHHLGVAAAGRAALDAEHGAEAGLTQAEHGLFAQGVQRVRQAAADGGLALARRGGADGRDQNQLALFLGLFGQPVVDLRLVFAVKADVILAKAQPRRDLGDGLQGRLLGDLDIRFHARHPFCHIAGAGGPRTFSILHGSRTGRRLQGPPQK